MSQYYHSMRSYVLRIYYVGSPSLRILHVFVHSTSTIKYEAGTIIIPTLQMTVYNQFFYGL